MKKRDIWMNIWQQELKAVIVRYDVAEFRSFYEKWKNADITNFRFLKTIVFLK